MKGKTIHPWFRNAFILGSFLSLVAGPPIRLTCWACWRWERMVGEWQKADLGVAARIESLQGRMDESERHVKVNALSL